MDVIFTSDFLKDLEKAGDKTLYRTLWRNIFDQNGKFKKSGNDHRYKGLKDKNIWIRYLSPKGYRLIYKLVGNKVLLYRVGSHSIEDDLVEPKNIKYEIPYENTSLLIEKCLYSDFGELLIHNQRKDITNVFKKMFHVKHDEIIFVSPYIDEELLSVYKPIGKFLDKAIEEGTLVTIITMFPEDKKLKFYEGLECRDIFVYFLRNLHTKLYLFDIDLSNLSTTFKNDYDDTVLIGSANLTYSGIGFSDKSTNEEICYKLPISKFHEARVYVNSLISASNDFTSYKKKYGGKR